MELKPGYKQTEVGVIPEDWKSGVYTVTLTIPGHQSQHMFVLRAAQPKARIAMVLATGTWCATRWPSHTPSKATPRRKTVRPQKSTPSRVWGLPCRK